MADVYEGTFQQSSCEWQINFPSRRHSFEAITTPEIQPLSNHRSCPMWLFGEGSDQYDYKPMKLLEHVQKHTVTANLVLPNL